jgi:hypothetical protein
VYLSLIFAGLWPQIPTIIIDLIGLGIAITRRERHPKVSLWAGIYFGGNLVVRLLTSVYLVLPTLLQGSDFSVVSIGTIFTLLNPACMPITAGLGIVLLYAIFGWREPNIDSNMNNAFL